MDVICERRHPSPQKYVLTPYYSLQGGSIACCAEPCTTYRWHVCPSVRPSVRHTLVLYQNDTRQDQVNIHRQTGPGLWRIKLIQKFETVHPK